MVSFKKSSQNYTKSFGIIFINKNEPIIQLNSTIDSVPSLLKKQLNEIKGIKHIETLKITFKKTTVHADKNEPKMIFKTAYFNSKAKTIINENEINESIQTSNEEILGSSYIELPPELRNFAKRLINPQNKDDQCFRWCHIRHLNPQEIHPERIKKCDKEHIKNLDHQCYLSSGTKRLQKNRNNEQH